MVKIFVGRLAESVTRDQLQKLFEKYGEVSDCDILRDYGFVHMANEEKAHNAIRELDRMDINGSRISVELSTSRSMKSCQLVVGNLPNNVSSHDVHKLFKKYGTVTLCRITGTQAVVHMRWASMAVQAIRSLNGETYKGNVISVQFANSSNSPNLGKVGKDEWYSGVSQTQKQGMVLSNRHQAPPPAPPRYQNLTQASVPQTSAWGNTNFTENQNPTTLTNGDVPSLPLKQNNPPKNPSTEKPTPVLPAPAPPVPQAPSVPAEPNPIPTLPPDAPTTTTSSSSFNARESYEDILKTSDTRSERQQKIKKGLQFLQSSMPWSGTPEQYEKFLNQMKQMLLKEGNELRSENNHMDALQKLSEALNMCQYMETEGISGYETDHVMLLTEKSEILIEMGRYASAIEDANKALQLTGGIHQVALRHKSKAMFKMGNIKEAYDLLLQFSQNHTLDSESTEMMNTLSNTLGLPLRPRKPYLPAGTRPPFTPFINNYNNDDIKMPDNSSLPFPQTNSAPNLMNMPPLVPNLFDGPPSGNPNVYQPFMNSHFGAPGIPGKPPSAMNPNSTNLLNGSQPVNDIGFSAIKADPTNGGLSQQAFNKTPGTGISRHFSGPTGLGLIGDTGISSNMISNPNGLITPTVTKPAVAPIGPIGGSVGVKPVNSNFAPHYSPIASPQSFSTIGDSLRKNLQSINLNEQNGSSNLRSVMENSLNLAPGLQSLSMPMENKPETNQITDPLRKMWNYNTKQPANSNNNGTAASNAIGPIGYRKPFSQIGLAGGDASSNMVAPPNPPFPDSSRPGIPSYSGDFAFDLNSNMPLTKSQDKEIGRALENEINSLTDTNFGPTAPSYMHFPHPQRPQLPSNLSQLFGPGAIGIGPKKDPIRPTVDSKLKPNILSASSVVENGIAMASPPQSSIHSAALQNQQNILSNFSADNMDVLDENNGDTLENYLRNPLYNTHEFRLGCSDCVVKTGPKVIEYKYDHTVVHTCYKNILLCRRRDSPDWHKIRPRPQPQSKAQLYDGPYYICKDLIANQDCTYPIVCTFAYNQEEIDVWTLERKQMLNRRWLFDSLDEEYMQHLTIVGRVLCKHRGLFDFLCHECFTNKPRIISTFNPATGKCVNSNMEHDRVEENKQLTHILRETTVRYQAIRVPPRQAILCRHEVRFQCTREGECHFAHSLVERDVWAIMLKKNITPEQVVEQARDYVSKTSTNTAPDQSIIQAADNGVTPFRWKVKFICSLCHKNGQIIQSTKDRKYCAARAQHSWGTNKKTVLVQTIRKDWTQIRDLPYLKNKALPARFELCENIRRQKKCSFSNKCNFAHSQEELDIWIYLRDNNLKDLEDLHDILTKEKSPTLNKQIASGGNSIRLPTDYFPQSAYHCWLCNKECNSQRQWEQHCLSEKHRLGALSDADGNWKYRNPGGNYELCERHMKNMCEFNFVPPEENKCCYAHSNEELEEWRQRREYVINRIKKAQEDKLISSNVDMEGLIKESQLKM